jgi:hypothetical protein
MEFYDGQARESNHEETMAFSPQAAIYAATLLAASGEPNENIEIVTNVEDPSVQLIEAHGATHEILSQFVPPHPNPDLSQQNHEAQKFAASGGFGLGGCAVVARGTVGNIFWIFVGLAFLSVLILRYQYSKKMKQPIVRPIGRMERLKRLEKFRVKFYRFTSPAATARNIPKIRS